VSQAEPKMKSQTLTAPSISPTRVQIYHLNILTFQIRSLVTVGPCVSSIRYAFLCYMQPMEWHGLSSVFNNPTRFRLSDFFSPEVPIP
jgi:hypothetical protein